MGNLERKQQISTIQLGALLVIATVGIQIVIADRILVEEAGSAVWLAILLGAVVFLGISYLMVKLNEYYPHVTVVEYMQRIWGRFFGNAILMCLVAQITLEIWAGLQGHIQRINFFLFDQTPPGFLTLMLVILITYGAMQDLGTLLRVIQIAFMVSLPFLVFVYLSNLLNVRGNNLMPLLAPEWEKIPASFTPIFNVYKGCEILLFFLPWVNKGRTNLKKIIALSFGYMVFLYLTAILVVIGVMGVEGVKGFTYPMTTVSKAIEIPGTFVERLEIYLLLAWVPLVFSNLLVLMNFAAQIITRIFGYQDHRPVVLALAPVVYIGGAALIGPNTAEYLDKAAAILGSFILFLVVPASFFLTWHRRRKTRNC